MQFYTQNCIAIGTQAALLSGFAYNGIIQVLPSTAGRAPGPPRTRPGRASLPRAATLVRLLLHHSHCPCGSPTPALGIGAAALAVTVRNEGEGIAPEHISRLTERFYRVDQARSRELGGTGLGLAIVKHIANRHRGRLVIKSTLGKGSAFTVYLPIVDNAAARPS